MRDKSIDSLKGIAVLMVIIVHFSQYYDVGMLDNVTKHGARGVQLFFVVNGYLSAYSIERYSCQDEYLLRWYKQKLVRLLPMYWLFSVIYLVIVPSGNTYWLNSSGKLSIYNVIANIICLHGFYPYYINSINLNWFVADIMVWYAVLPIMWRFWNKYETC